MIVKEISDNVHNIYIEGNQVEIAVLSDLHWDNPKCDRVLLKKHLDHCKENNIPIVIVGDLFCLMQGRGDNRRNKSDIRPEHNNSKYLDSIVDTAVEWFSPYAHLMAVIGYGNHETAIIKWQETDILKRFVKMLNIKNDSNVYTGGYGGWIVYTLKYKNSPKAQATSSIRHKYFHGSGGGGIVTKGAINLTRALEMYENMDLFTMGHIHENASRNDVRETLEYVTGKYYLKHKEIHHAITGTYKEEYQDGSKGWHVERGAPPKPLGGRLITINITHRTVDGKERLVKKVDSRRFNM
jgi:UDP-2,3-diacylglucosamine pyrophosphatase LpxH